MYVIPTNAKTGIVFAGMNVRRTTVVTIDVVVVPRIGGQSTEDFGVIHAARPVHNIDEATL
jgi:hypothetical protein